jgi:hypothetical protein
VRKQERLAVVAAAYASKIPKARKKQEGRPQGTKTEGPQRTKELAEGMMEDGWANRQQRPTVEEVK